MSDMVDRLEALQTIRVGLEETCAHLTTQLLAAERRLKETEAAGAALIDPLFLRRVAERVREACARTLFTCSSHTLEEAIEAKLPCAHQRQMTCIRAVDVDAIIKEATRG